jgi:hypothetical protein
MIVGAHIKRPVTKLMTYCPSVATVVANTNNTSLHFPGSVRIQPTLSRYTEPDKGEGTSLKGRVESSILNITQMMRERFQVWDGPVPNDILVYSDGITFDNSHIWAEYGGTVTAHRSMFLEAMKKPLRITFVVLNKDARLTLLPDIKTQDKPAVPASPKLIFATDKSECPKYQYYVMKNEIELTGDELRELVSDLDSVLIFCEILLTRT